MNKNKDKNAEENIKDNFFEKVYDICRQIPKGKVATYGQIAFMLGSPRSARQVGWAMRSCPYKDVPCHRVLNRFGKLCINDSFGHQEIQKQLLEEEGIEVNFEYIVDLDKYLW